MVRRTDWPEEPFDGPFDGQSPGGQPFQGHASGDGGDGELFGGDEQSGRSQAFGTGEESDRSGGRAGRGGLSGGGYRGGRGGRSSARGRRASRSREGGDGAFGEGRGGSFGDRAPRGGGHAGDQDGGSPDPSRAGKGESRTRERDLPPEERARNICLRLLTGTPRTRKQLADALRKREIPDDVAEEVLSRFEEVGLIDDTAFAGAWVESRHHSRGLARRALARELRTKGVDSTAIDEAMEQLDSEQEEATARELVDRKLRSTRGLDRDKRLRRLAGMLARKGYPEGMALRVVRRALEQEGEETDDLEYGGF
ncbi:recombination regulator RecX [Streptomyces sp. LHD-70]|uniref:recombination regulator RecX n=1 Tax=Streptomyces sp. LHD-70 TaxID=3072140 RepID=UPI00280D5F31|nr:recombination regulator RecX [Streptomyces sp. LHD-70]MDQ8703452.1 recombination regulator RecX [Streptomyces sp. LHD-70]